MIRVSLVVLVATLVAMPLLGNTNGWIAMRLLAGFTSAMVFVGAVNWMVDNLRHHSPYLTGWGFGGVGVGIAVSGSLVLILPATASWRSAWWVAGVLAAILSVGAWAMRSKSATASEMKPRRTIAAIGHLTNRAHYARPLMVELLIAKTPLVLAHCGPYCSATHRRAVLESWPQ